MTAVPPGNDRPEPVTRPLAGPPTRDDYRGIHAPCCFARPPRLRGGGRPLLLAGCTTVGPGAPAKSGVPATEAARDELLKAAERRLVADCLSARGLTPTARPRAPDEDRAFRAALFGAGPRELSVTLATGATVTAHTDGCLATARHRLYGDQHRWFRAQVTVDNLRAEAQDRMRADPVHRAALARWTGCVAPPGRPARPSGPGRGRPLRPRDRTRLRTRTAGVRRAGRRARPASRRAHHIPAVARPRAAAGSRTARTHPPAPPAERPHPPVKRILATTVAALLATTGLALAPPPEPPNAPAATSASGRKPTSAVSAPTGAGTTAGGRAGSPTPTPPGPTTASPAPVSRTTSASTRTPGRAVA